MFTNKLYFGVPQLYKNCGAEVGDSAKNKFKK